MHRAVTKSGALRFAPIVLASLGLCACGSAASDATPAACLRGPAAYLSALRALPSPARLAGGTPISACLPASQEPGDQARVAAALIRAATELNAEALRDPGGPASLSLGYLAGALERGTEGGSGIQAELVRRVESAARFSGNRGSLPPAFERGYARGLAAGRAHG